MGGGSATAGEIPLLSSFLYLLGWAERVRLGLSPRRHGVLEPSVLGCVDGVVSRPWIAAPGRGGQTLRFVPLGDAAWPCFRAQFTPSRDPIRGHRQAGCLSGAEHLSKNNAGVPRPAQRGQKPRVEQKGKSWLDPDVQYA